MLHAFRWPVWCQEVVVTADAAYASQANMTLMQELGYGYVLALPRNWKFAGGRLSACICAGGGWSGCAGN
ncbi:MAG TPA: hypothetical protein VLK82_05460 [Candidatus Tectomicrobia bacterium]|nr:hypothetical protein [Candidatus Tectomicrobia bacterium]